MAFMPKILPIYLYGPISPLKEPFKGNVGFPGSSAVFRQKFLLLGVGLAATWFRQVLRGGLDCVGCVNPFPLILNPPTP